MDNSVLHLIAVKVTVLMVLAATAACGVRMDGRGHASADDDFGDAKNQLILLVDGGYSLELSSGDVKCRRMVDDQVLQLGFRQETGPDAGLEVSLMTAGTLKSGDAVTADNSGRDRFFDFRMTTPAGVSYRFSSSEPATLGAATGSLTILKATDLNAAGRLSLAALAPAGGPPEGNRPAPGPVSVRGSFDCARWE